MLARSFLYVPKGTLHVYKNVEEETGRMLVSRTPWAGMPASVVTPRCAAYPTGCSTGLLVARRYSPSTLHSPPDRRPQDRISRDGAEYDFQQHAC